MADQPFVDESGRAEAIKLFETAREHVERCEFAEAKRLYERSLHLYEDPHVREAYRKFMATIGPM